VRSGIRTPYGSKADSSSRKITMHDALYQAEESVKSIVAVENICGRFGTARQRRMCPCRKRFFRYHVTQFECGLV
jgi:hypothetical protein